MLLLDVLKALKKANICLKENTVYEPNLGQTGKFLREVLGRLMAEKL